MFWIIFLVVVTIAVLLLLLGYFLYRRRSIVIEAPVKSLTQESGKELYKSTKTFNFTDGSAKKAMAVSVEKSGKTDFIDNPLVGDDASAPHEVHRRTIHDIRLPHDDLPLDSSSEQDMSEAVALADFEADLTQPDQVTITEITPAITDAEQTLDQIGDDTHSVKDYISVEKIIDRPLINEPIVENIVDTQTTIIQDVPAGSIADRDQEQQQHSDLHDDLHASDTPYADTHEAQGARALERFRSRLANSHSAFGKSVLGLLGAGELDADSWEDIEDTLIAADIGAQTAHTITEKLRVAITSRTMRNSTEIRAALIDILIEQLHPEYDRSIHALPHDGKPAVILVVGVNGTGKTSTVGKLAKVLNAQGVSVLLAAADTFRAAAADQLEIWARRSGAQIVRGAENADPSSVAFEAVASGVDQGIDVIIVDTAGRLHTKVGLMDELGKIKRVVEKKAVVTEVFLVLDATIGQNGLMQAKVFSDAAAVTGVVLTKLDGSAKGGIVFQVQNELKVPVKMVGLGEGSDDLAPFDPQAYVNALLG